MTKLRLIFSTLRYSPRRTFFILAASSIAGVLEGISIIALLPILELVIGSSSSEGNSGTVVNLFYEFFAYLNLELSLFNTLSSFFIFILLKSILIGSKLFVLSKYALDESI